MKKNYSTRDFIADTEREAKKLSILSLLENDPRKAASIRAKLTSKRALLGDLKRFWKTGFRREDGSPAIETR